MQPTEISHINYVLYPDRMPTPVLQPVYGVLKVSAPSGAGRPFKQGEVQKTWSIKHIIFIVLYLSNDIK